MELARRVGRLLPGESAAAGAAARSFPVGVARSEVVGPSSICSPGSYYVLVRSCRGVVVAWVLVRVTKLSICWVSNLRVSYLLFYLSNLTLG